MREMTIPNIEKVSEKEWQRNIALVMRADGYPTEVITEYLGITAGQIQKLIACDQGIIWEYEVRIRAILKNEMLELCGLPLGTMKVCSHFNRCHNGKKCRAGLAAAGMVKQFPDAVIYGEMYEVPRRSFISSKNKPAAG
jgi:hypothetical protein